MAAVKDWFLDVFGLVFFVGFGMEVRENMWEPANFAAFGNFCCRLGSYLDSSSDWYVSDTLTQVYNMIQLM